MEAEVNIMEQTLDVTALKVVALIDCKNKKLGQILSLTQDMRAAIIKEDIVSLQRYIDSKQSCIEDIDQLDILLQGANLTQEKAQQLLVQIQEQDTANLSTGKQILEIYTNHIKKIKNGQKYMNVCKSMQKNKGSTFFDYKE